MEKAKEGLIVLWKNNDDNWISLGKEGVPDNVTDPTVWGREEVLGYLANIYDRVDIKRMRIFDVYVKEIEINISLT